MSSQTTNPADPDAVFNRQARYRLPIAASHYVTWFLGRRFRRAAPLVFVTGYPKSGTTWVTQLIADALRLPYPRQSLLPVMFPAVVHGHQLPDPRMQRGVYVARDGRDVMVSLYFYLSRGIPAGDNPPLTRAQRRWFPGLKNKDHVRANLPRFIERQMLRPSFTRGVNWNRHVLSHLERDDLSMAYVRYEDLLTHTAQHLTRLVDQIEGGRVSGEDIERTVARFSFEQLTGRTSGNESRRDFLRKGQAGDWKNYFTAEAAQVFHDHSWEALSLAGYESDPNWVDRAESPQDAAA